MSSSLGLVDFAIGLVNPVLNLPDRQVKVFFAVFKLQEKLPTRKVTHKLQRKEKLPANYKRMVKYPARQKIFRAS